jgi:hypothetical protein
VTIGADVMSIDGLQFKITASRRIKFTTPEYVPKRSKTNLMNYLKVYEIYTKRCFTITTSLMDR